MTTSMAKQWQLKQIISHSKRIFKKPISKAPARLQNMLLKLQKYSLVIVFKKGSKIYLADTLSRAYFKNGPLKQEITQYEVMNIDYSHLSSKDWRISKSHCCRWDLSQNCR